MLGQVLLWNPDQNPNKQQMRLQQEIEKKKGCLFFHLVLKCGRKHVGEHFQKDWKQELHKWDDYKYCKRN